MPRSRPVSRASVNSMTRFARCSRSRPPSCAPRADGALTLRLPYRPPLDWSTLSDWLRVRALPGVAEMNGNVYRRTLRLPRGAGVVALEPIDTHIRCTLRLESMADLTSAVRQCRRLLDLDADPLSVVEVLSQDRRLVRIVKRRPGL